MEEHYGRCLVLKLWKGQETTRQEPQGEDVKHVMDNYNRIYMKGQGFQVNI